MKLLKNVLVLCLIFACAFSCIAYASDEISVVVDGQKVEFDVPPQIMEGRTMLPMRKTFEAFGANVEWIGEMNLVLATYKSKIVAMEIGKDNFKVTDVLEGKSEFFELDVKATIVDGRTLVPVRAIAESFGFDVAWDGETRTVTITK